jgi:hypothetical protein
MNYLFAADYPEHIKTSKGIEREQTSGRRLNLWGCG